MTTYRLLGQTSIGQTPGDALRLSAGATQPIASPDLTLPQPAPAADPLGLAPYIDTLSLTAPVPAPEAAPATARVQPLGPLARARAAQAAAQTTTLAPATTPAVTPTVAAPAQPAPTLPATPAPAPVAAPAYAPETDDAKVHASIAQASTDDAAFKAAEKLLVEELEKRHAQPADDKDPDKTPAKPDDKPEQPGANKPEQPKPDTSGDAEKLKDLQPAELARLGREDKKGFFDALRPAAEEAEKKYGVPAAITLAQAALETGWGQHIIPGYNLFGIKGTGPAGTTSQGTWEVYSGKKVTITANFAKYHNFYEGVTLHGKLFHNGYYDKAINQYAKDHDPFNFAKNITGVYATDPSYGEKLSSIIRQYKLV